MIQNKSKGIVISIIAALVVIAGPSVQSQITMTSGITADQAVQYLLGPNVQYSNASFIGNAIQLGQLSGGGGTSNFQISDGIVLCSDDAVTLQAGSTPGNVTPDISTEPDLLAVANSVPGLIGQSFSVSGVHNVAILEFDFIATGNELSFNYIFGSNEYLTYVNTQYNDVFAFFLSGPGIVGTYASPAAFPGGAVNIASVPSSNPTLPITISSVNNVLNSQYYVDNQTQVDIASNGYTTTFQATHDLMCGQTYHIKLAIADGTDQILQSFVCLEAGSFSVGTNLIQPIAVTTAGQSPIPGWPANSILEGENCYNGQFIIHPAPCAIEPDTILIQYSGTATYGTDYNTGGVTQLIIYPDTPDTLFIVPAVDNVDEGTDTIFYANGTPIYCETITLTFIYVDPLNGDLDTASATLNLVDYTPTNLGVVPGIENLCPGTTQSVSVTGLFTGGVPNYTYSWTNAAGMVVGTQASQNFSEGSAGLYTVTVTDFCHIADSAQISITEPSPFSVTPEADLCVGEALTDILTGGTSPYSLSNGGMNFVFNEALESIVGLLGAADPYQLIFIDACNQDDTLDAYVHVCELFTSNIITPNGDFDPSNPVTDNMMYNLYNVPTGNESFYVYGLESFTNRKLRIYNQWGVLVFTSEDYQNNWSPSKEEAPDGTYYYTLSALNPNGTVHDRHGNFMIVR